ncbi:MAG: hypothetical protein ABI488_21715 [Polyangiaceae bacterium]
MSSRAWLLAVLSTGAILGACSTEGGQCLDASGYPLNPQPDLPGCRFSNSAGSGTVGSAGSLNSAGGTVGSAGSPSGSGGSSGIGFAGSSAVGGSSAAGSSSAAGGFPSIGEGGMGGTPSFEAGAGGVTAEAGEAGTAASHH